MRVTGRLWALMALLSLSVWGMKPELPKGAYPEWRTGKAWSEKSDCRETICINGLWQWRSEDRVPEEKKENAVWLGDLEAGNLNAWKILDTNLVNVTVDEKRRTEGTASHRIDVDAPVNSNLYHAGFFWNGLLTGKPLVLTFDVYNGLNTDSAVFELQDARGYEYYSVKGDAISTAEGWQSYSIRFMLPEDTTEVKLIAARVYRADKRIQGSLWIDNMRIYVQEHPITGPVTVPEDMAWGYSKVPGFWSTLTWCDDLDPHSDAPAGAPRAWYRRTVEVPSKWTDRRISLHFDDLSTDGWVFVNGQLVGRVGYTGGDVEITEQALPGSTIDVAVLVEGRYARDAVHEVLVQRAEKCRGGINGDVFLKSEPKGLRMGDVCVTTVVEPEKKLKLEIPLSEQTDHDLSYSCTVYMFDRWIPVHSFKGTLPAGSVTLSVEDAWAKAKLWDYREPNLYTLRVKLLDGKKLLDETLPVRFGFREFKIVGKEFRLNGVKINLMPCAYWPVTGNWHTKEAMRHWLKKAIEAGYNYVYTDKLNYPGRVQVAKHFLEICDELGIMAGVDTLNFGWTLATNIGSNPDRGGKIGSIYDKWCECVSHIVRPNVNHPSLVMWRMNMNLNCYAQDQNPLCLDGKMDFAPGSRSAKLAEGMLASNAFVHSLDPTRPTYNHACGKTGEIYTCNNYLGWPELQDLREWLRVWAEQGEKPLFMVEQATPYPGDFQMRDPSRWWKNEPVMTEYAAILLGDDAYRLEENSFVDYPDTIWEPETRTWKQSYQKYCNEYPRVIDICSSRYYEAMLPAWRTWGITGGINAWENCWRRLKKGVTPEPPKLETPWKDLQRPGFDHHFWHYGSGGGGEIRTLFDLGRAEEKDYFETTERGKVMPQLIAPLYAYIGGPNERWYTVEHAYRDCEIVEKSVVIINDKRKECSFDVSWECEMDGKSIISGATAVKVAPGCVEKVPVTFRLPRVNYRKNLTIKAKVKNGWLENIPVKPFDIQVFPTHAPSLPSFYRGWALYDPEGKTREALLKNGVKMDTIAAGAQLPENLEVLVIGCGALDSGATFPDLSQRVQNGLRVLIFEQSAETLTERFGLRAFTPGVRMANIRTSGHPALVSLRAEDFRDWRGTTTLGALDGAPLSLDLNQRVKRVWRCSQEGVVASTIVEKPHQTAFLPLLDGGFDLRYMMLWETVSGYGRMMFCQLDVTDRAGIDPIADTVIRNLVRYMGVRNLEHIASHEVSAPERAGTGKVLLLKSGQFPDGRALMYFLRTGGTVVAAGLDKDEAEYLARLTQWQFHVADATRWKNSLDTPAPVPQSFAGVSPAEIHWRKKVTCPVVRSVVVGGGWMNQTGTLADIPVEQGRIVWISGSPDDFNPQDRADLIFSRVNSQRLLTLVMNNAGAQWGADWTSFLTTGGLKGDPKLFYTDTRTTHDDPYAYMRW